MSVDLLFKAVTLGACILIYAITEPALNLGSIKTRRCIRISLFLLCSGAVLIGAAIIPGVIPTPWPGTAALASGVALMLFTNRRRRVRHG